MECLSGESVKVGLSLPAVSRILKGKTYRNVYIGLSPENRKRAAGTQMDLLIERVRETLPADGLTSGQLVLFLKPLGYSEGVIPKLAKANVIVKTGTLKRCPTGTTLPGFESYVRCAYPTEILRTATSRRSRLFNYLARSRIVFGPFVDRLTTEPESEFIADDLTPNDSWNNDFAFKGESFAHFRGHRALVRV